jgi:hypothetical protein
MAVWGGLMAMIYLAYIGKIQLLVLQLVGAYYPPWRIKLAVLKSKNSFSQKVTITLWCTYRSRSNKHYALDVVVDMNLKYWKEIKKTEGQALVEMALVLPILLLLFMGIFEFGRIMGAYMILSDLARDGVRHGVVGYSDENIEELIDNRRAWWNLI